MGRLLLVSFLVVAAACADAFSPPRGAVQIFPPPAFRVAWQEVEACSGRSGSFDRVRWFLTPGSFMRCGDLTCAGIWHPPHDIYLTEFAAADSAGRYFTVRHEILHDLLAGGADHPAVFDTCGVRRRLAPLPDQRAQPPKRALQLGHSVVKRPPPASRPVGLAVLRRIAQAPRVSDTPD